MTITYAVQLLDAFVRYAYNVEFEDFKQLYSDCASDDYLLGKYRSMQRNLGAFYGELDTERRRILVKLIADRYEQHEGVTLDIGDDPA